MQCATLKSADAGVEAHLQTAPEPAPDRGSASRSKPQNCCCEALEFSDAPALVHPLRVADPRSDRARTGWRLPIVGVLVLTLALVLPGRTRAEDAYAALVKKDYEAAQTRFQKEPKSGEAAWQFARACFDLGELATNNTERAQIAQRGIAAAHQLLAQETNSAPGHYYLGMNLAQMARTRGLGALKIVSQMEQEFSRTIQLDEHLDYAGADRNLGLLYRDAPSVISIGSKSKARQHLQRAVELAPNYPENSLNLIESSWKWGDRTGARRQMEKLDAGWTAAHAELTGVKWSASWTDWEERRDKIRKKMDEAGH